MQAELIKTDTLSTIEIIQLREQFVSDYCTTKNWNVSDLSVEQVLEIRAHKQWKTPGMLNS